MAVDSDSMTKNARLLGAVSMQDLEIQSVTIIRDTKSEEADSQFAEDTTSSHHGALSEGEMNNGCIIQYPVTSAKKSQIVLEVVMGGETGGYLNCCQEFAAVKQDMDDPRTTTYVPSVRITKGAPINSRCIEYNRHVTRCGWKSAHREPVTRRD